MTKREFLLALAVLESGTGHSFDKRQAEVWYEMLRHHTVHAFQTAIKRCLLERIYPGLPQIGEINRLAAEAAHGIPLSAEQAFERVREAVSKFGYIEPGKAAAFLGSDLWSVVSGIGGWDRICDSPVDQRQSLFAQFRDGWIRQQDRRQQELRLPEDVRPMQRLAESKQQANEAVKTIAHAFSVTNPINSERTEAR